jgi:type IV fimbrial biogenesis protein FimT
VAQVAPAQSLQQRASGESPGITATPGSASLVVTFLPTGFVDTTGDRLSRVSLSSAVSNTESRRIDIFGGGLIRMCDPSATATNDPRRC